MQKESFLRASAVGATATVLALIAAGLREDARADQNESGSPEDVCILESAGVRVSVSEQHPFRIARTTLDEQCEPITTIYERNEAVAAGLLTEAEAAQMEADAQEAMSSGGVSTSAITCGISCGGTSSAYIKVENQMWDTPAGPFKLTWVNSWTNWAYRRSTKTVTDVWGGGCNGGRAPDGWSLYDGPHCYYLSNPPRARVEHIGAANFRWVAHSYDHFQEAWAIARWSGSGTAWCDQYGRVPRFADFRCVVISRAP